MDRIGRCRNLVCHPDMGIGPLIFLLFVLAAFCLLVSRHLRRQSGLPRGEIIYEDSDGKNARVLISRRHCLRGKPDYLLDDGAGGIIPVELKSGPMPRGSRPHRSHVMQLAVYFLLVEEELRRDVHYGIIRYKNGESRIENTEGLRDELLDVVEEMREALFDDDLRRSHEDARRCGACSMAHACEERLM
jgi:CRISPR-associated exonuclease Cas4